MVLLDTTALIDLSRRPDAPNRRRVVPLLNGLLAAGDTLFTSRINEAEFRVGGLRSSDPARETTKIEAVLATLVVLEFDAASARRFAEVQAHLFALGRPSGDLDALIASVALTNHQRIITRDPRHFAAVPGLVVETY